MAKLSQADLLAQFEELTLVELSDFVKAFETEFDVRCRLTEDCCNQGSTWHQLSSWSQGSKGPSRCNTCDPHRKGNKGSRREGKDCSRSCWRKGDNQVISNYLIRLNKKGLGDYPGALSPFRRNVKTVTPKIYFF